MRKLFVLELSPSQQSIASSLIGQAKVFSGFGRFAQPLAAPRIVNELFHFFN